MMADVSSSPSLGPNRASASKFGKNAFFFIIVTVFIDMMAFAVIMPSMPYLVAELLYGQEAITAAKAAAAAGNAVDLQRMVADATPWGGYITTIFAIMNFLFQPVLGNLSDRYGRRPILLFSMAFLAIDFVIMGMAHAIWLLFLGRFLSGISAATHSTAAAYIADTTEPAQRGQAFGMLGAAFGLGFILGPAIGGYLGKVDPRFPFFAAAGLAGINFLYGFFVLPESLDKEHRRRFDWKRANAFGAFKHFSKVPYLAWFMLALGLFNFAHWVYPSTFNYYAAVNFNWDPDMIGIALGVVGVGSAVVQGALVGKVIKKYGPTKTVIFGFAVVILTFAAYAFVTDGWMVFVIIPLGALAGVLGPALNQIMSARAPKNAQGELQGAIASVQALSNVFAPLAMTQTFFFFTHSGAPFYFPGAAFALAAIVAALSMLPLLQGLRTVPRVVEQPSDPAGEGVPPPAEKAPDAATQTA
jgi:MFS transporter, DHA1 family, tetracycline resistance protein